jgi:hypothetical protein
MLLLTCSCHSCKSNDAPASYPAPTLETPEQAYAFLARAQIRAAGLDVFEQEPLATDSPLADPGLRGERPADLVNPSVWEIGRQGFASKKI